MVKSRTLFSLFVFSCYLLPNVVLGQGPLWQAYFDAGTKAASEGKNEEAVRKLNLALREARAFGQADSRLSRTYHELSANLMTLGRLKEADQMADRALTLRKLNDGPASEGVGASYYIKGGIAIREGKLAEAERHYRTSLAIREAILPADHSDIAWTLLAIGQTYSGQRRYERAEACFQRAMVIWEKALGAEHPAIAMICDNWSDVLRKQRKFPEAEPLARRALAIQEKAHPSPHTDVALALRRVAVICIEKQNFAEAEAILRRADGIHERAQPPNPLERAATLDLLASAIRKQGRPEQGEAFESYARQIRKEGK